MQSRVNSIFFIIKLSEVRLQTGDFVCEYAGEVLGAEAAKHRIQRQMEVSTWPGLSDMLIIIRDFALSDEDIPTCRKTSPTT